MSAPGSTSPAIQLPGSYQLLETLEYLLEHPNYEYVNRIAHFRSVKKEIRLSLNKTYLASVIEALRKAGVWPLILNQDFLKVNNKCKKSNKGKVKKELANLLS